MRPNPDALQFDRATQAGEPQSGVAAVSCSRCKAAITTHYYQLDGETVCASCKQAAMEAGVIQASGGAFVRAGIFGFGAAVAGAAIYYGVIAIANLEIGIVAILIGYMVGAAIRKGARGGGGRRYQILAIALTYFSVGLAYAPLAFNGSTLGATFLLVFALPVIVVVGNMPSGLISALIIAIGMHQAWRMTAGHTLQVTGPYKVGGDAAAAGT